VANSSVDAYVDAMGAGLGYARQKQDNFERRAVASLLRALEQEAGIVAKLIKFYPDRLTCKFINTALVLPVFLNTYRSAVCSISDIVTNFRKTDVSKELQAVRDNYEDSDELALVFSAYGDHLPVLAVHNFRITDTVDGDWCILVKHNDQSRWKIQPWSTLIEDIKRCTTSRVDNSLLCT
jgi:hypothetical protein